MSALRTAARLYGRHMVVLSAARIAQYLCVFLWSALAALVLGVWIAGGWQ